MSYARSAENLASKFGCTHHQSLLEFKKAINTIFAKGGNIQITCPLGTHFSGEINKSNIEENLDVGVLRFPMLVPTPISANAFSGKVVLSKYLTPTGSKVYEPASIALSEDVLAIVEKGKISHFEGDKETVKKIQNHYENISKMFEIEKYNIDSWP